MSEWKTMESAPRDGRIFFAYAPEIGIPVHCRWDFEALSYHLFAPNFFSSLVESSPVKATHWTELAAPTNG